jgi:hypothetical protein
MDPAVLFGILEEQLGKPTMALLKSYYRQDPEIAPPSSTIPRGSAG